MHDDICSGYRGVFILVLKQYSYDLCTFMYVPYSLKSLKQ